MRLHVLGGALSHALYLALDSAVNHYQVLSIPPGSSLADVKAAYHRALLRFHPDKNPSAKLSPATIDIASIQEAYRVLSTPDLRSQHDYILQQSYTPATGPRPAQIISLEEFQEHVDFWSHSCRCGGVYKITAEEMDGGQHLIPCSSCSEIIWVGYELVEE
ncbi:DnaJ domain-containing protein [Mycena crocata]|nr:DnaJ domain-containing protein [Mycena crocata]